ncbi:MAG UNVERIFIED_CONTAM: hypothetical protein LVR18_12675 [Planctomycetaceae bacterium]|jgi:hypothetical protein
MSAAQPYATEGDNSNFNTASLPPQVRRKFPWLRLGGTLISMSLFGLSLTGYGYATEDPTIPRNWASCFLLLLIGWLGLFEGITAWLANPTMALRGCLPLHRFAGCPSDYQCWRCSSH